MKALVASFPLADVVLDAARMVRGAGFPLLDALTPYPLPSLTALVGSGVPSIRLPMGIAGFGLAIAFFGLEWWSAVYAYPFNEGSRPLFSWPVFLLSPFEVGVLAAAVVGFAAFLVHCGLPRLNHPIFELPGIERATQDRFVLIVDPLDAERLPRLRALLFEAGAIAVSEEEA